MICYLFREMNFYILGERRYAGGMGVKIKITEYFEEAETEAEYFYSAVEAPAAGSNLRPSEREPDTPAGGFRFSGAAFRNIPCCYWLAAPVETDTARAVERLFYQTGAALAA
jgi:hypothetical protein